MINDKIFFEGFIIKYYLRYGLYTVHEPEQKFYIYRLNLKSTFKNEKINQIRFLHRCFFIGL